VIGWRDWSPSDLLNRWGEEFKGFEEFEQSKEFRSSGVQDGEERDVGLRPNSAG
jgi:hypothetical protein